MTKQEKIKKSLLLKIESIRAWRTRSDDPLSAEDDVDDILRNLHSQGVVIKRSKGCKGCPLVAVEPLIEE